MPRPNLVTLDLEGVLVPEVWINVAERTGIEALRRTTRDEPDYTRLMQGRLNILDEHGLKLPDIQKVIGTLEPLQGALEFLDWLRAEVPLVILSDTFYEFADPLMRKLARPALFCNSLVVSEDGRITGFELRQPDQKRQSVIALKQLNFKIIAAGDSYNDTGMLKEADAGILFRPPDNVIQDFPQFPVTTTYAELRAAIEANLG
ncbi:MAG: bifunctional phosphoserine phosphatase/homoserine phosphotransferase ThrH [Candidatus Omnitrophica bacterium]|nr:bifunctional phosphoserine phosphatase/homoserine phosphotransferase ThrH [Candidatus Omnitrophota bacterium]